MTQIPVSEQVFGAKTLPVRKVLVLVSVLAVFGSIISSSPHLKHSLAATRRVELAVNGASRVF